jgi:ABC-type nitrate/sulfonate/bicarbonate transport system ATPase subunit
MIKPLEGPPDQLGVVFQRDVLLDWRTILDNVLLQAEFLGKGAQSIANGRLQLLQRFGLEGFEIAIHGSCPAACGSGFRSAGHCYATRTCC